MLTLYTSYPFNNEIQFKKIFTSRIALHVLIDDTEFCFRVENKFDKEIRKNNKKSGFGLYNLRERLKLIYPERHNLKIEEINNIFIAKLCIQIANQ